MARSRRRDPGGQFASDEHRRVLGHLGQRAAEGYTTLQLLERMAPESETSFENTNEVMEVLQELGDDRLAKEGQHGWYMTRAGFDLLTGPIADEPPPKGGDRR